MSPKASNTRETAALPTGPGGHPPLIKHQFFPTPVHRRIAYALVFEVLAIIFTTLILTGLGNSAGASALLGVVSSLVALGWNVVFNTVFERWEKRSGITGRPWRLRLLHTVFFECGLVVILIPLVSMILQVSLARALGLEAGLIIFFLAYNAGYTWCFDRVFGLPLSAREAGTT